MEETEDKTKDAVWRKKLTKEQYQVMRNKDTERPFTGKYWDNHEKGEYICAGCGAPIFDSKTKFESGCGWPSFYVPKYEKNIETKTDRSFGMLRTEVLCKKCGGHLGHVFKDGPKPTGLRYCINSISLDFKKL
ncbi:MAG: peptide-methionine (R)-S-oxide reductase MsrB [Candidatus Lokiarchaeota archaeon]|nr:peptide-methionine (R)-S-oxide reductase MsrB [Candidatus Lokiarchaeota archaeon]